jgi:hypothetical protein
MDWLILSITVFASTFLLCRLYDQKKELARAVQHYQAFFEGEFPKRIRVRGAAAPAAVFEIRRLEPEAVKP